MIGRVRRATHDVSPVVRRVANHTYRTATYPRRDTTETAAVTSDGYDQR